eukprot:scaffold7264_cov168-Amphora_coffeaeformis.AAC.2
MIHDRRTAARLEKKLWGGAISIRKEVTRPRQSYFGMVLVPTARRGMYAAYVDRTSLLFHAKFSEATI